MCFTRSVIFLFLWFIWTFSWGIICSPFLVLKSGHKILLNIGKIWASVTLYLLNKICNIHFKVIGKTPNASFIAAVKHQSAWETIFLLYYFKNPVFIIKKELTRIPIYGWYLKKMSMIAIDRSNGMNALKQIKSGVQSAIEQNRPIIIFPEGTRTKPNERIPYKSGIRFLYDNFSIKVPIIPIALNSGKYWINKSILKKSGTIIVKILFPIQQSENFLENLQNIIDSESERL